MCDAGVLDKSARLSGRPIGKVAAYSPWSTTGCATGTSAASTLPTPAA
jgi:hypothetical protein